MKNILIKQSWIFCRLYRTCSCYWPKISSNCWWCSEYSVAKIKHYRSREQDTATVRIFGRNTTRNFLRCKTKFAYHVVAVTQTSYCYSENYWLEENSENGPCGRWHGSLQVLLCWYPQSFRESLIDCLSDDSDDVAKEVLSMCNYFVSPSTIHILLPKFQQLLSSNTKKSFMLTLQNRKILLWLNSLLQLLCKWATTLNLPWLIIFLKKLLALSYRHYLRQHR